MSSIDEPYDVGLLVSASTRSARRRVASAAVVARIVTGPRDVSMVRRDILPAANILTPPIGRTRYMPHLLGIDIGTSGTKTLICDEDGKVIATAMAEHPIFSPKPGWSEQHPEDWWQATIK